MSDPSRVRGSTGEKLLVVDDDPFIARLLEIELAAAGYQVRVANDGQQAIDLPWREDAPDLVITDVMMPHVDGFELTRSLRQDPRDRDVSVIILTARGLSADKLEGFAIGADDYIVKPFDTPELLARVRGVLRRKREMKDESPLTGLPGNNRIQEEIEGKVVAEEDFALLLVDLDRFKAFNDHYGFPRGDKVIQDACAADARRRDGSRRRRRRSSGTSGGDDFVVVVPSSAAALVADTIVQRFDASVRRLLRGRGSRARVDRGAQPTRRAAALRADRAVDRGREHPAPGVRAFRRGAGDRDRDEELHEDHARARPGRSIAAAASRPAVPAGRYGTLAVAHTEVNERAERSPPSRCPRPRS